MLSKCQETGNFRDDIFYSQITYTIHWHFHPYHYPGSSLKGTRGHFLSRTNVRSYKNLGQKALEFMQSGGAKRAELIVLEITNVYESKTNLPSPPLLLRTPRVLFFSKGVKDNTAPSPSAYVSARHPKMFFLLAATGSRQQLLLPPFSSSLIESATLRLHGS